MKWTIAFPLVCLVALAYVGQTQAGFRVKPASDAPAGDGAETDGNHEDGDGEVPRGGEGPGGGEGPEDGGHEGSNPLQHMVHYFFKRFDADKDGTISVREAPEWLKKRIAKLDKNRDGKIDPKELMEMLISHRKHERPDKQPKDQPREKTGRSPKY